IDVECKLAAGTRVDQLAQLVPVAGPGGEQGEDEQLGGSPLQLAVERSGVYICHEQIVYEQISKINPFNHGLARGPPSSGRPGEKRGRGHDKLCEAKGAQIMAARQPLDTTRELLEAFDHSCRVSEYLVSVLPKELWRVEHPGGRQRSIAAMVAHMQSARRMFAKMGGAQP